MVTSPRVSTSILSIPLGPRLVRTSSETSFAAWILFLCASFPFVCVDPSFRRMIGVCCVGNVILYHVGHIMCVRYILILLQMCQKNWFDPINCRKVGVL